MQSYEEFNENQEKLLKRFVTNTKSNVFVLCNLPEVIKGAMFSRYSRSSLGLRSLLLKEFIQDNETAFEEIVGQDEKGGEAQFLAIQKAQNFYDRILDGYGDDSIGELGGAHLAIENVSMIAAKMLEDSRIGGSFLEKSTRYIYFDQKVNGEYMYYREPVLMTSAYKKEYVETCNMLFDTYSQLIPPTTKLIEKSFPKDPKISSAAYAAALRAKVLDCLRGLLPAATLTNMGIFGNGRFYEQLLHKLSSQSLLELQDIGKKSYEELSKVIPSFVRRSSTNHKHHEAFLDFYDTMQENLSEVTAHYAPEKTSRFEPGVKLISYNGDALAKVAAALMYSSGHHSLEDLQHQAKMLSAEELIKIFEAVSLPRENRRHKSPRALEHAQFTFEIVADFGIYRDLHRHRILTQERQFLTCEYGYYIPEEILNTPMEAPYREAMEKARIAHSHIAKELTEEAQYLVPMAYNVCWYFHANLRALQWLCELRSSAAGHPNYRFVAQEMAKQITTVFPPFAPLFKFVDYDGHSLGRLSQEQRKAEKLGKI